MDTKNMCSVITPYICPVCKQPTLFFVNKYNKIIDYKALIDRQTTLYGIKNFIAANHAVAIKVIAISIFFPFLHFFKKIMQGITPALPAHRLLFTYPPQKPFISLTNMALCARRNFYFSTSAF